MSRQNGEPLKQHEKSSLNYVMGSNAQADLVVGQTQI